MSASDTRTCGRAVSMWHEGVRLALLRLRLFRAMRFVYTARAMQVLSRECYTAANHRRVRDGQAQRLVGALRAHHAPPVH